MLKLIGPPVSKCNIWTRYGRPVLRRLQARQREEGLMCKKIICFDDTVEMEPQRSPCESVRTAHLLQPYRGWTNWGGDGCNSISVSSSQKSSNYGASTWGASGHLDVCLPGRGGKTTVVPAISSAGVLAPVVCISRASGYSLPHWCGVVTKL